MTKIPFFAKAFGGREKIRNLLKLFIAAVILFTLFFVLFRLDFNALAFFEDGKNNQILISEELIVPQLQSMDDAFIRKNSYVYSSGYGFIGTDIDSDDGFGGHESANSSILIQGIAFLSPANPGGTTGSFYSFNKQRSGIIAYKVQPGDTISYIAASFGISVNTVLWANNLSYWSLIRPGDKLVILPASGVLHKVKKGETLANIVKKYKGDIEKTIAFNGLPAGGTIQISQDIVIPGGRKVIYYSQPAVQFASYTRPYAGKSHGFPWGHCTWYIAGKRYIPWGGHAKYWLTNAKRYGFQTGFYPIPGSIMVTREGWYGHVAYVEKVSGNYVYISEMHMGRGKLKTRKLYKNDWRIRGYIY